jgi:Flp pilus assembly protein TadG
MPALALSHHLRALRSDRSGMALMEFAFTLPIVLAIGGWGVELSFLSLTNLRVSQYALTLADNASRVGVVGSGGVEQLRESDLNDVLQGSRLEGQSVDLTTNGRITLSSLENVQRTYADGTSDSAPVQRIHWQRCIGMMSGSGYDSTYGTTTTNAGTDTTESTAGTTAPTGMGDAGKKVNAIANSGIMFVEVNYRYKPAFGGMFLNPQTIHYTASFIVRDNRDFSHIYNPTPTATASTCNLHTKGVGGATT